MKKTIKKISMLCLGLVIATSFVACNLDSSMGIFEAIGNSEPVLDTTNQSILGFDGDYVYVKAQDGIYRYGTSNNSSDVENLRDIVPALTVKTNGFASSIGNPISATAFVYQESDNVLKKLTLNDPLEISDGVYYSAPDKTDTAITTIVGMNNGMVLLQEGSRTDVNKPWTYTYKVSILGDDGLENEWSLPANSPPNVKPNSYGPGILFGSYGNALGTMINEYANQNKKNVYNFKYYWDGNELTIAQNNDLDKIVASNIATDPTHTTNTNFIRIQAYQPPIQNSPGIAIAKIANDSYTSLIFTQQSTNDPLVYIGQSNFYLNYYSAYGVPSVRVTINGTDYMLVPYSSGLRLIKFSDPKESAIDNPTQYAYASSNTTSFAQGLTYNNVVDIKPIPGCDSTDPDKNKYLVSTVNSGVYTITLPSEVGSPSDDTKNGSRKAGYQPIKVETPSITKSNDNKITISCSTSEAKIYYTTDGSEPSASSSEYTDTFNLGTATIVKAIAIKNKQPNSDIATYTVS